MHHHVHSLSSSINLLIPLPHSPWTTTSATIYYTSASPNTTTERTDTGCPMPLSLAEHILPLDSPIPDVGDNRSLSDSSNPQWWTPQPTQSPLSIFHQGLKCLTTLNLITDYMGKMLRSDRAFVSTGGFFEWRRFWAFCSCHLRHRCVVRGCSEWCRE